MEWLSVQSMMFLITILEYALVTICVHGVIILRTLEMLKTYQEDRF